jgi:pimeloyl-ACP methyl ester carboxylesterase
MTRLVRPATQADRRSVTVAGTVVHFRETATDGPPLVLVHGLSGSTRWWSRNLDVLGKRFHVYAIDLPGFGDNRRWCRFSLADAHTHLSAWMDAIGLARASIIGHSMGGLIAANLALSDPPRIDRLILVDAPIIPDSRNWLRFGVHFAASTLKLPLGFVPMLMADALRAGPFTLGRASRAIRQLNQPPPLQDITAPTLVLWGEHDRMFPPDYGQHVAAALPHASFALIEGAGHNAMWDRPGEFNRLVLDFLT